jgi:5-keto-L-gluconate epimerase
VVLQKKFQVKTAFSMSPEKSSFSPLLFAGDLYKGLNAAKDLGYDGVELSLRDSKILDQEKIIKTLEKLGLEVFSIATGQSYFSDGFSFSSDSKESRNNAVERMKGHVDFAQILNCSLIVGGILGNIREKFGHGTEVEKKVIDCFSRCLEYAKNKNVSILFEPINLYLTYFICTLDEGADFINRLGYKNLELIPDTHHMAMEEKSIEQSLIKHAGLFHYLHFSDSNRQAPGFGNINFQNIVEILKQREFNGVISFEILPVPDDISAAKQAIDFLNNLLR